MGQPLNGFGLRADDQERHPLLPAGRRQGVRQRQLSGHRGPRGQHLRRLHRSHQHQLHGQQPLQRHGQGLVQRHVQRRLHPRHQRMEPARSPARRIPRSGRPRRHREGRRDAPRNRYLRPHPLPQHQQRGHQQGLRSAAGGLQTLLRGAGRRHHDTDRVLRGTTRHQTAGGLRQRLFGQRERLDQIRQYAAPASGHARGLCRRGAGPRAGCGRHRQSGRPDDRRRRPRGAAQTRHRFVGIPALHDPVQFRRLAHRRHDRSLHERLSGPAPRQVLRGDGQG